MPENREFSQLDVITSIPDPSADCLHVLVPGEAAPVDQNKRITLNALFASPPALGSTTPAAVSGTTITGSGILSIDDTTDSSSTTTGSIHTDGGLGVAKKIYVGDDIVPSSTKGINFSVDGGDNLNLYAKATYSPEFSTNAVDFDSITYTTQVGFYVELPDCYLVWGVLTINAVTVGSASGNLILTLPVTSQNTGSLRGGVNVIQAASWASATKAPVTGSIDPNTAYAFLLTHSGSDARSPISTALVPGDVTAGTTMRFYGNIPK